MEDTIFKPLTHLDREGPEANNDRFQRRDNTSYHDSAFSEMDTDSIHPQKGWQPDTEPQDEESVEANGCLCPNGSDGVEIYEETVVIEFYDDTDTETK
ncbi:MAG: hypothetical protein LIO85_07875 [Rikenellaceae bacterium]|nr:hypothetical protein [Rikenellaceae bacterium]